MTNIDSKSIKELEKKLLKIDNSSLQQNNKLGKIGEKLVKNGIKYYLWGKGFKVRKTGNRTFTIKSQYKAGKGGVGGIDFRLEIRLYGKTYDCYVEVKNWKKYKFIPKTMFDTEILGRFTKNANQKGCIWIVVMNKRNVHLIQKRCKQNNIHIIPLEEHITSGYLNTTSLTYIMEQFIDDFSNLINAITGRKLQTPKTKAKTTCEKIKDEIRLGKPYSLIASTHNRTEKYVQKIATEMKNKGEKLPDRRTKEWRLMQYMTKSGLDELQ
jgi:hypothetical protein